MAKDLAVQSPSHSINSNIYSYLGIGLILKIVRNSLPTGQLSLHVGEGMTSEYILKADPSTAYRIRALRTRKIQTELSRYQAQRKWQGAPESAGWVQVGARSLGLWKHEKNMDRFSRVQKDNSQCRFFGVLSLRKRSPVQDCLLENDLQLRDSSLEVFAAILVKGNKIWSSIFLKMRDKKIK